MTNTSPALLRKRALRKTTPRFVRHANHRKASLNDHWRKPRGLHNKQKDHKKGSFARPSDGYRTPVEVRGLHISGFEIVRVGNINDLKGVDAKTQAVVLIRTGAAKQLAILKMCQEKKIKVLNFKIDERIKTINARRDAAQLASAAAAKAKAAKTEKSKKAEKKHEEKLSAEEKKEADDKLKEDVLTSKSN